MKTATQRFLWKYVPHVFRLEGREMPGSILAGGSVVPWWDSLAGFFNLEPGFSEQPLAALASTSSSGKQTYQTSALVLPGDNPVFAMSERGIMPVLGLTVESSSGPKLGNPAPSDINIQGIYINYWYNGDFDSRTFLANESNTFVDDARVYDNFIVPGDGKVQCICLIYIKEFMNFRTQRANWELREWVKPHDPGILIASGTDWPATQVPTGQSFKGLDEYRIEVDLGTFPVYIPAGQYWVNITPVGQGQGVGFIGTTSGQNGYGIPPGNDGNSFFDSQTYGFNFEPTQTILGKGTWDFSMGLDTMPMK